MQAGIQSLPIMAAAMYGGLLAMMSNVRSAGTLASKSLSTNSMRSKTA